MILGIWIKNGEVILGLKGRTKKYFRLRVQERRKDFREKDQERWNDFKIKGQGRF